MPVPIEQRLAERGWSKAEIEKATSILGDTQEPRRVSYQKQLTPPVYWLSLIIAIVANFIISVVLIPFLLVIQNALTIYAIVALLALAFGFFFNLLLTSMEAIAPRQHVIAGIFIPALALINIIIVVNLTSVINQVFLGTSFQQNAIAIAVVYVAAFIGPYALNKLIDYFQTRKAAQTL